MASLTARIIHRLKSSRFVNQRVRYNRRYYDEVRHLLRNLDVMDRDQRRELSLRLTERALGWAHLATAGRGSGTSLADWPILEKDELRENLQRYLVPKYSWLASVTAGVTGVPVTVHRSLRCLAAGQAFIDDLLGVWDVTFASARIARLRGDNIKSAEDDQPPYGAYRSRGRMLILSSRHLHHQTVQWFHQELEAFKPDLLYASPTSGEALTRFLTERGLKLKLPLILTSSQGLSLRTRRFMEETFEATVIDYYNQVERVSFAAGVAVGAYYFNPAYGHVELLPVPDAEAPKGYRAFEIIGTGFWNEAMPLVRYRTDDLVIVPASYTPSDIDDVTLGLKPVAAIRRRDMEHLKL